MLRRCCWLVLLMVLPGLAPAHPLPNLRYDRQVEVKLLPSGVSVTYTVELNEWTMVLDGRGLITKEDAARTSSSREFAKLYAERKAPHLADNLLATADGQDLFFKMEQWTIEPERDHLKMRFRFSVSWPRGELPKEFQLVDQNFEDRAGQLQLILVADGLTLLNVVIPTDLHAKSSLDYLPGEDQRARRVAAVLQPLPQAPAVAGPLEPMPWPVVEAQPPPGLWQDLRERGLVALFDSGFGVGALLLLSALFGMAHAFTPGHGKTMVAAYLVGERGTPAHAVLLGLSTTLAHTGGVIALALIVWLVYGDRAPVQQLRGWLTFLGGLLITVVGIWLVLARLSGTADHVHLTTERPTANTGWFRVILLGLGGGLIPCYDAVIMFCLALFQGRLGLAIPLLLSFSAGLSLVLVALGLGVVWANRRGSQRFREKKWFQYLPVVSAIILVVIGLLFSREGWHELDAPESAGRTTATAR